MKCYRFKHVPTEMYFRPSRHEVQIKRPLDPGEKYPRYAYVKTNLSKKGKVYSSMPSWSWLGGRYYNHLVAKKLFCTTELKNLPQWQKSVSMPVLRSEWIIEEVTDEKLPPPKKMSPEERVEAAQRNHVAIVGNFNE